VAPHFDADRALFVLALADDDPEQREALAHARECASCREVLREAEAMLALFDDAGADELRAARRQITPAFEARVQRAVLGSPRTRHLSQLTVFIGALLSALMVWTRAEPEHTAFAYEGVHCLLYEQMFAAGALGLGLLFGRWYGSTIGPWPAASMAMIGALFGQELLQTRCHAQGAVVHLLLFHALGVALATVLGGVAGRVVRRESGRLP
jgi:hypothetical protein